MSWHKEPRRHSLARRGVKTSTKNTQDRVIKKEKSPYIRNDGSVVRVMMGEDGLYYNVRDFKDGTEIWSRKGQKTIQEAEKKRDDVIEEDRYWDCKEKLFSEKEHFKKRAELREKIKKYPRFQFPASLGLEMAQLDIQWWSHYIKDEKKKKTFIQEANNLIEKNKPYKKGMDVPRGTDIEWLYYKIDKGYTREQYADHLQSYD